ncbi:MAG TPA: sigma-70 family RNA polymerase sigma factor [Candidatus Corynebacterium avicola]|uniref:Sigma-70 family RNA polymerase sigma factor n=1 Tax=Candidatus Corynebacterium avicola TaxID=2838527 RepID=A0A9D1RL43_9CORY|nr:sigma-70 family RNA polymerase sigma factor [Candidatus Corynebacterium avicola]
MTVPFDHAVKQHGATVLRVCRAVLGTTADAEDAWSETFLSALRTWDETSRVDNLEAWLVRVAHRKTLDITRARARHAVPTGKVPDVASSCTAPGDGQDHHSLWDTVAALPERQRLAVAYHYLGGLPHAETAELIGGTSAAVRRAASDGIRALRRTWLTESAPEASDHPEPEDPHV